MPRSKRPTRNVLELDLRDDVQELRADLGLLARAPREELRHLVQAIGRARDDRRISALVVKLAQPRIGAAKVASLRRAIGAFRKTGKPTLAYLEGGSNLDYALACSCETVVLQPGATLHLEGLRADVLFFKDLLARLGLEVQIEAVGEYKSMGEMVTRRGASEAYQEELEALLRELGAQLVAAVSEGRGLSAEQAAALIENGPYLAEEAVERGLVDGVQHQDEARAFLEQRLGAKLRTVPAARYRVDEGRLARLFTFRRPRIAIVYAVGIIGSGGLRRSRPVRQVLAAEKIAQFLKRARASRRVKAVVLRIESPGGSAVASEQIWREVSLTREKKPVIVSMGDVAASGGYYIATAADAILAEAPTLTGSIGVVGGKLVVHRLLQKLGIHQETIALSPGAGSLSPLRPFTDAERARFREHLLHFYEKLFLPRVAAGRKLSIEQAHQVGRGRVWTGNQGRDRGLVDEIGGLDDAIARAREKAGIAPGRKTRLVAYARRPRLRELLSFGAPWGESLSARLGMDAVEDWLEALARGEALFLMLAKLRIR